MHIIRSGQPGSWNNQMWPESWHAQKAVQKAGFEQNCAWKLLHLESWYGSQKCALKAGLTEIVPESCCTHKAGMTAKNKP